MKQFLIILFVTFLYSCESTKRATVDDNKRFEIYKKEFIAALWKQNPVWASGIGFHDYDSVLFVPNDALRLKEITFSKQHLDSLNTFSKESLSSSNVIDLELISAQLKSSKWYISSFKSFEWNPSEYNVCGVFSEMLANDYASLNERLENFYLRMKNVPAYYAAAKKNIQNPSLEHTKLAINQNEGGIACFTSDLETSLAKSTLPENKKNMLRQRALASLKAVEDYVLWLKQLKNTKPKSFRIGKKLYLKKFEHDIQSAYSADVVYAKALKHKGNLHKEMYKLAIKLWGKYMKSASVPSDSLETIHAVINQIALNHISADDFQNEIGRQIPILEAFIKTKNLIYIDPSKPLVVRKEPAYMAGVAGASISSPGPYDKKGNTYYNVGSFTGWDAAKTESYLREYNNYTLQILNIHEAIPGHYTQLVYANKAPSLIKSIFGNGTMIEGWAVYTERMMLENGFGNNSDEMWLMYYKWNLRTTCNTLLDYGVHVNNLSKENAMNLLIKQAFQEQAEAEGKWKRATLTQVQLCSYFTGFTEIMDLRDEVKKKEGKKFNLKNFHERFLSFGSAPVKHIKELMK